MREILIGTGNPSKLELLCSFFDGTGVVCRSPITMGLKCDCAEKAVSAEGNALEKALAWHQASGMAVFTEDSGLVLLDLPPNHPDQPGVHVRRVHGETLDDTAMLAYYRQLVHRHGGQLRAAWQDAYCLLLDEQHYSTWVESDEDLAASAFLLRDVPNGLTHPGWPLNSLSYPLDNDAAAHEPRISYHARMKTWIADWVRHMLA